MAFRGFSDFGQVEVLPKLWLGCFVSSLNHDLLTKNSIGLVVNMTEFTTPMGERLDGVTYLRFAMADAWIENDATMQRYNRLFSGAAAAIQRFRLEYPEKSVLVHCMAGINRSSTALGYHLIVHHGMAHDDVFSLLTRCNRQHRRVDCLTNKDFRSLLRELSNATLAKRVTTNAV